MPPALDDKAILALTKAGEHELQEAGTTLTPVQLEALVLIDGHASVAQVLKRARDTPAESLRASLAEIVKLGYARSLTHSALDALDPGDFFTSGNVQSNFVEMGPQVDAEAAANTEFLRQNGYCVNLARRPMVVWKRPGGRKPLVLVIDDDPDICELLRNYFKLEGFETRSAGNREEIISELRRSPLPDAVMLDVWLPDANGFDILNKMRQHPVLKGLPIVMLTAEANREAVLKGILGGADGYITKPFDIHHMVRAVRAVLGLKDGPIGQDWDYSL